MLKFLVEQITFLNTNKHKFRYCTETLGQSSKSLVIRENL